MGDTLGPGSRNLFGRRTSIGLAINRYGEEYKTGNRFLYGLRLTTWVVVLGGCTAFMIEQVTVSIIKVVDPPVSTQTRLITNQSLVYPAITVCYRNQDRHSYQESVLKDLGMRGYWKIS